MSQPATSVFDGRVALGPIDVLVANHGAGRVAQLDERIPVGRVGRPEEVADLALTVLRNGYMTSQVVSIDGGMYPR